MKIKNVIIIILFSIKIIQTQVTKKVKVEIIIPGSCLYNPVNLIQKSENDLWSYPNLYNLHLNESQKLNIPITEPKLSEIKITDQSNKYFHITIEYEAKKKTECLFYIFNWPGKRTKSHFFHAAEVLYFEIKNLIKILEKKYDNISINIIGYSHGGNIGVLITHWIKTYKDNKCIIENIYLLGTPIGQTTLNHINIKNNKNQFILKKVINLYNPEDWVQTFDKAFDLQCQQTIPSSRKNIKNKIVMEDQRTSKINKSLFKKGYSLHMFYLEEEFLCNQFFIIKNKL